MKKLRFCFFALVQCIFHSVSAQNLDKIGSKEMLTIHGGINFNTVNYSAFNMENRRDPFTWFASGNLTINVLDVAIPLNYSYSNLGGKFTQPFNQFSLHPTYKKWQSHIGYSSMSFSNYSLAGHLFMGGGLEYKPDHWEFKAMGGRFNKPIQYDAVADNLNEITYARYGGSVMAGYNNNGHELKIIALKARDQTNSLTYIPLNSTIKPKDNVVISLLGKTKIANSLSINAEYAMSALTANLFSEIERNEKEVFSAFLINNATTSIFQAYKTSLAYQIKTQQISFNYEHIDPGYSTLGGYFFNNDLENYTLAYNGSFLNGKLNGGLNTGLQLNNLDQTKAATTKRLVGSFNASGQLNKNWTLSGNYSNFSNFTRKRPAADPFFVPLGDTLNFYNQAITAGIQSTISFGKKKLKHNLSTVFNFSRNTNVSGSFNSVGVYGFGAPIGIAYDVLSFNQNYTLVIASFGLNVSTGVNLSLIHI